MVLSEKTTFVWSISLIILVIGVTSKDVIGLSTNQTTLNGSLVDETTKVEYQLSGNLLDSNADTCPLSGQCQNGGSCVYEDGANHCQCKNGTSGAHCEIVDECVNNKCGIQKDVQCIYNIAKEIAECKCNNASQSFDSFKKLCRLPCKTSKDCPKAVGCRKNPDNDFRFCNCPFGSGGDQCDQEIDECKVAGLDCGNNPNVTCEKNKTGHAVCYCPDWNNAFNYVLKDCVRCDCGGNNMGCHFLPGGQKKCYCYGDYYERDGKCEDCKCGFASNGCKLENGTKVCDCWGKFLQNNDTCEDCDCGTHSNGCSFQNGEKTCVCKLGYIQFNGTCRTKCNGWFSNNCKNSANCRNSVCQCLPGTHGDLCEIVDGCEYDWKIHYLCGYDKDVKCVYNQTSRTPFCKCDSESYVFDDSYLGCRECDCGKHGNCSYHFGAKKCQCEKGYKATEQYWGRHIECKECDCGPIGVCVFDENREKFCNCPYGYSNKEGSCAPCNCGLYGDCEFNEYGEETCNCRDGYGVMDGKCKKCECYWGDRWFATKPINCTFKYGIQKCLCPAGYEEKLNKYCSTIDKCEDSNPCPMNMDCKSTPENYTCTCAKGYKPYDERDETSYGCIDINECEEQNECPYRDTTECINTKGSYYCVCKSGYYSKYTNKIEYDGCQKDQTGWKIGYVILIVVFGIVTLGLSFAICRRRRYCS